MAIAFRLRSSATRSGYHRFGLSFRDVEDLLAQRASWSATSGSSARIFRIRRSNVPCTARDRLGCCVGPSTIPACTRNRDALGVVAWVAFPYAVGPKDSIGRFRGGIRRPKVAAAFQADPELVELPGFPGTWVCEIHERAAALAAHLKIDIAHESHSSAEPSWCLAGCLSRSLLIGQLCLRDRGAPRYT